MNTKVSYGALAPAMIGGLGVVVNALLAKARRGEAPASLRKLPDVIEFSDSGIWGDDSLDPDVEPRVFRVSDFDGDFRLDYSSAPPRAVTSDKLSKFRLRCGDILVVKSSGSAKQVVSGRVAVFDTEDKQVFAASNFLLRLRPKEDMDPHYLAFVLGSPPTREAVADSVKTMTYPNLSFRIYSTVEVPVIPLSDQKVVGAFFRALLNNKPLPDLPSYLAEQRRVVARVEELAAQIDEARTLRLQAAEEAEALLVAMAHRADLDESAKERAGWKRRRLSDVIQFVDDAHKVAPDRSYPNFGIYSFGRGLFHKPPIDGLATSATTLRRVKAGQFIYSRLFAFEGAYGRVTPEFDGAFVSQEYPTFDCDSRQIRSEFLAAYFKPAHLWKAVAAGSKGLGDRRQRVQPAQVLAHELWLPPIEWQNRLAKVQAEVDALKRLQAETAAELDALLPSILDKAFKGEL